MANKTNSKSINKKKWLALTAVGAALLLIPRRSSRKASYVDTNVNSAAGNNKPVNNDDTN